MIRSYSSFSLLAVLMFFNYRLLIAALPIEFDAGTYGCPAGSTSFIKSNSSLISNTNYDSIYLSECYSTSATFTYSIADAEIEAGQNYTLYLHFAEIYHGAGNTNPSGGNQSRIFHVEVEGVRILDSLNIHALVGPSAALVYRYDVVAGIDGDIDVTFVEVVGDPKISAMEVRTFGEASSFPPTTYIYHINTGGVLPVELADFSAIPLQNQTARLSWTTFSETNNLGFDVQKADSKGVFYSIGFVQGTGNASTTTTYSFETQALTSGNHIFRLGQVDLDGSVHYSFLTEVKISSPEESITTTLFPNPALNETSLRVLVDETQNIAVSVLALDGKTVKPAFYQQILAGLNTEITLNVMDLPQGIYMIKISGNGITRWEKMAVSK
ncbi:MAG: malectin domain-containing carbohydrate-binding protein [Bacteroidia bacterium]|nr:malectin domain-containing carbohydrate-binding protein [Bacteroidia bacterium]